jgi:signal transduction histidine kinase
LEIIERNARSQVRLIDDLLDLSRIITGKLRLNVQPVALASVVEAAADAMRPTAEARGIRLQVLLDPQAGPVSGDPDRLQQVLWNLLSNAIKFTPKGGRVQVRLERINSHVEITVSDTGQGISAEFLPHVFDRFRQADATNTRKHGGLGLGLSDCAPARAIAWRLSSGGQPWRGTGHDLHCDIAAHGCPSAREFS